MHRTRQENYAVTIALAKVHAFLAKPEFSADFEGEFDAFYIFLKSKNLQFVAHVKNGN